MSLRSVSEDIRDLFDLNPSLGLTKDLVFAFKQPNKPNLCLTLFDTSGLAPEPQYRYDRPGLQIRGRGDQDDVRGAYDLTQSAKEYLRTNQELIVNGARYIQFVVLSDIFFQGFDAQNRPEFTLNFVVYRTES